MSLAFPKPEPKAKKARQGLKRSYLKRKKARRIDRKTADEAAFLTWLHSQQCAGKGITFVVDGYTVRHWCHAGLYDQDPIQAAHFRDHTGMSRKETDITCIPLCRELHRDYDGSAPHFFKGWPLEAKKDWHRLRQAETQARWEAARK